MSGDAKVFRWKTIFFPPPTCLRASLFILPKCGGGSSTIRCYSFFSFFFKRSFVETNLSFFFFLRKTVKSKVRRGEIPPSRIRSLSTYIINLCISSPNGQKEDLASFAKCRYRSFYAFRKARARERKRRAFRSVGRNKSARITITTSAQRVPCKRNDSIHPKPSSTPSSYHPSAR